jgi:hypothetical protein
VNDETPWRRAHQVESVTPGSVTGPLNVKSVRLSRGCAETGAAIRQTNTVTAQAKPKIRVLSMIGPPYLYLSMLTRASLTVEWRFVVARATRLDGAQERLTPSSVPLRGGRRVRQLHSREEVETRHCAYLLPCSRELLLVLQLRLDLDPSRFDAVLERYREP